MRFEKVSFEQYFKDCVPENIDDSLKAECKKILKQEWNNIILPTRATKYSAGYDIHSVADFKLEPGEIITMKLGIKVSLDRDKALVIVPRSGAGFKYGIELLNSIGIIDCDFYNNPGNEGHIAIKLRNPGYNGTWRVKTGDAIAQGIIVKYYTTDNDVPGGERIGGFGSTSKK